MSQPMIGMWMMVAMIICIFIGFPISFTLIFLGLIFGYWGFGKLVFYQLTLQFNGSMMEQTLAAVPLFVFMGIMMEQANLMERLFDAVQKMLSRLTGALYLAVKTEGELQERARNLHCDGTRLYNPGWHTTRDIRNMLTVSECVARRPPLVTGSVG